MVVDCHYHHIPDMLSTEKLIACMDRYGIDKTALMAQLNGPINDPPAILITLMRFALNRPLLRGLAKKSITVFTPEGNVKLPSGVIDIYPVPDNAPVFDVAAQYPDRFFAWCMVNPGGPADPVAELERWENHPSFIGVKAHPFWHRFAPEKLLPVGERLLKKNLPMILHLGFGGHGDILALADALPDLKIILAHAGFPCYADTWKAIQGRKNICVDLSATAYVDPSIMKRVCDALGVERCLYGSDGPFGSHGDSGHFDLGVIKGNVEKVFPDKGVQQRILGGNFLELISKA